MDKLAIPAAELAVAVASGAILAIAGKVIDASNLPYLGGRVPFWLLAGSVASTAMVTFFVTRRLGRGPDQAFVIVAAPTGTGFLADLLAHLARALDQHGIDLVAKLPRHDHSVQSQRQVFGSLVRRRRTYVGGFVVPHQPELMGRELGQLGRGLGRPIVFLDVRPFPHADLYPPDGAFVGTDPSAIGELAADWIAASLTDRVIATPHVLVIGGDAQVARHSRFEARLRERMPAAHVEVDLTGHFERDRAREIVARHVRQLARQGQTLNAVFCTNDEMALGAADACRAHAESGGADDPVIIGVDGNPHALATIRAGASPLRATVVQDPRRIAEVAVDRFLRLRVGQPVEPETFTPATVYSSQ